METTSNETRETKFINSKYLSKTATPSFHDFSSTLADDIAAYSTTFDSPNAYKLMMTWITYYNTAIRLYRTPQTKLQRHLSTASITFKSIYTKTTNLRAYKDSLITDSIQKSASFIQYSGNLLQKTISLDIDQENSSTSRTTTTDSVDDSVSSPSTDKGIIPPDNASIENDDQVRSKLISSLNTYKKTKKFVPVVYKSSGKSRHLELLLKEACSIVNSHKIDSNDLNFLKLALSSSINLLGHTFRQKYATLLPKASLESLRSDCTTRRHSFTSTDTPIDATINTIFNAIKEFQFDPSPDRMTSWIDSQKANEENKHCEKYRVLKVLEKCIDNFVVLNKQRISEATYCGILHSLLQTILLGSDMDMIDGENIPESTKRMSILNQYNATQFGRRADIIIYESYQSENIEYAVVEFKTHSASDSYKNISNRKISGSMQQY